ncbi:MAG: hypothetical protein GEU83_16225 [Pseudonocardiaceae bacterium]|nr:hypothetical protein [Pseudonocardiaceae bacterium]
MCAGPADVHGLFETAVRLVDRHCPWARSIHIVAPQPHAARERIALHRLSHRPVVHADQEVVPEPVMHLPGWFRQQYVKLHADLVCGVEQVVCIGADTLVLDPIAEHDLYRDGLPLLRFFRYDEPNPHLPFERTRVLNVAAQLATQPDRTFLPGDFVCDVFPMADSHLHALRSHLDRLHGPDGLARVLGALGQPRRQDNRTGEWTMYAVFVLDALRDSTALLLADRGWAQQIHTAADLARSAPYSAHIIHFVHEPGGTAAVLADLEKSGRLTLWA